MAWAESSRARRLVACFPEGRMRWSATLEVARRASTSPTSSGRRPRYVAFTFRAFAPETLAAAQKTLIGYLSEGAIQPTIAKVFSLSDAADAVRHLIEDRPFGRVLMRVGTEARMQDASASVVPS